MISCMYPFGFSLKTVLVDILYCCAFTTATICDRYNSITHALKRETHNSFRDLKNHVERQYCPAIKKAPNSLYRIYWFLINWIIKMTEFAVTLYIHIHLYLHSSNIFIIFLTSRNIGLKRCVSNNETTGPLTAYCIVLYFAPPH